MSYSLVSETGCSNWESLGLGNHDVSSGLAGVLACQALCEEHSLCQDFNVGRSGTQFSGLCSLLRSGCFQRSDSEWDLYTGPPPPPTPAPAPGDEFTIVIIPDTQYMTFDSSWGRAYPRLAWPEKWHVQADWVANNTNNLDIAAVLHVGDIVEEGCNDGHWWELGRENVGWDKIQASGIPYCWAPGNHDLNFPAQTSWDCFNERAPKYLDNLSFEHEHYAPGIYQGMMTLFERNGVKFIVLGIEWGAGHEKIEWARQKLEEHSDRYAIFITHFVGAEAGVLELARNYPKTVFVAQGHDCVYGEEWYWFHESASGGQPFNEMLIDYQCFDNGYLGYLTINTREGIIKKNTYNPWKDSFRYGGVYEYDWQYDFGVSETASTFQWPKLNSTYSGPWPAEARQVPEAYFRD